jgi:inward rectifier potassium channel
MQRKPKRVILPGANYEVRIVGDRHRPLRDFYHALLTLSWPTTITLIVLGFLFANALFAAAYVEVGGITNARPGSFADAFYFSVQTMGTIGYGAMYPSGTAANLLVVAESIVSLTVTALATGLVFAKVSRPTARVVFTRNAVISKMNGVPTLMLRVGNERGNRIVDSQIRATLARTEKTHEGHVFFRSYDLHLARGRALSLSRSWSVMHVIDAHSPLHGETPESVIASEVEIHVMVVGLDDISMQTVHASRTYYAHHIAWGARFVDILSDAEDGAMVIDVSKFHDTEPTQATPDFPYPQA